MLLTNVIDNCDISGYDYEHDLSQSSNLRLWRYPHPV